MLSSILNSSQAIQVNIQIVRIFSRLRNILNEQSDFKMEISEIKQQLSHHDKSIALVFNYVDELVQHKNNPVKRKRIGYKSDDL
ncbi:hypothetical protein [Pedobacter psychrophilus]|uniref:hypothetical protein n=1 Tax=Pedobacter psychrophilus TaxID=1826909 RepID=UPI001E6434FB|nr:hypothetical protein [Pedobacter psychrophilus]